MTGLYIHVPFCVSKCPYCDFYSLPLPDAAALDAYADAVCRRLEVLPAIKADTLYFGGGTPSLLGGKRIARLINAAVPFLTAEAEITMEANPAESLYDTFAAFAAVGGNRLSLGMQAANDAALCALGRRHTTALLDNAVRDAHRAGIDNLSLDIMLGTPRQTRDDVRDAVAACVAYDAAHVSAYMLKLEPGTPFATCADTLALPDEDETVALYLTACEALDAAGYQQYEISNFARNGRHSRHNLKYWNGDPYIGIGPSAHSFFDGKRWYYKRSLESFLRGEPPLAEDPDAAIGDDSAEEYAMLRLRLTEGLRADLFCERFGATPPPPWWENARRLPPSLVIVDDDRIALTREGFLLSNTLIAKILWSE